MFRNNKPTLNVNPKTNVMKKSLLSLAFAAAALSASADKVVIIASGSEEFYEGDATEMVILPPGFSTATCGPVVTKAGKLSWANKKSNSYSAAIRWQKNDVLTITPTAGLTIEKMVVRSQTASYCVAIDNRFTLDGLVQTGVLNESVEFQLSNAKENRCSYIELEYSGTPTQAYPPTAASWLPFVKSDEGAVLVPGNEGGKIYYTRNAKTSTEAPADPTSSSTLYTSPIEIGYSILGQYVPASIVKAITVKDGMSDSFVFEKTYLEVDAQDTEASFIFQNGFDLVTDDGQHITASDLVADGTNFKVDIPDKTFVDNGISLVCDGGMRVFNSTTFGGTTQLRLYANNTLTVRVPEGQNLTTIVLTGSSIGSISLAEGEKGQTLTDPTNSSNLIWIAPSGEKVESVKFECTKSTMYIDWIYAWAAGTPAGIDGITVDDQDAPVEYFNLQGVRVANPSNGLYIRRQGNKVEKVVVE